jgi:hypothetical protein
LTILLAAVGAMLLVPAANAFANGTVTVNIKGSASGKISSVGGFEGSGSGEGSPPIECSGPPSSGTCSTELVKEEIEPGVELEIIALHLATAAPVGVKEWEMVGGGSPICPEGINAHCLVVGFGGNVTVNVTLFESQTLTVSRSGSGNGKVVSSPSGIECPFTCKHDFEKGTEVTLTATPEGSFSVFKEWTGACSGTGSCKVTMSAAKSVNAVFVKTFALSVSKTGEGSGTVTSSPSGINCGGTCSAEFGEGTEVTLTASPAEGSTFAGWSGACSGTGSCKVTMSEAKSVTASFALKSGPTNLRTLTLKKSAGGTGGTGTVSSKPKGINCGSACNEAVASMYENSVVVLKAKASTGSTIASWTGCETSTGVGGAEGTCEVTMSAAKEVKVAWSGTSKEILSAKALTLSKGESSGKGTVKAAGLACEAECTSTTVLYQGPTGVEPKVKPGKTVTLKEVAAFGSEFSGWSGCGSEVEGNCVVTMEAAKAVSAEFTLKPTTTLTLNKGGTGTGSVSSKPKAINCGATCTTQSASVPKEEAVILKEKPGTGMTFTGWSGGGCSGTAETCTVSLSGASSVTASFSGSPKEIPNAKALTLTKAGSGYGTVKAAGLTCEVLCTSTVSLYQGPTGVEPKVKPGKTVTLKATSAPGSKTVVWSGCESEVEGNCVVTMEGAKGVTATFDELP